MSNHSSRSKHLAAVDPALGRCIARIGSLARRQAEPREPYTALLSAVAHQQLHGNAARAMLGRLMLLAGGAMPEPAALLAMSDQALRDCGFSANKALALRDIAANAASGVIPSRAAARRLTDAALIERLVSIRGVGRWTVEMLLIFTLGRPDIFPVDDFGVREGYRIVHALDVQPKPKPLAVLAEIYAPFRSTAALYYWRAADLAKPVKSVAVAKPEI